MSLFLLSNKVTHLVFLSELTAAGGHWQLVTSGNQPQLPDLAIKCKIWRFLSCNLRQINLHLLFALILNKSCNVTINVKTLKILFSSNFCQNLAILVDNSSFMRLSCTFLTFFFRFLANFLANFSDYIYVARFAVAVSTQPSGNTETNTDRLYFTFFTHISIRKQKETIFTLKICWSDRRMEKQKLTLQNQIQIKSESYQP